MTQEALSVDQVLNDVRMLFGAGDIRAELQELKEWWRWSVRRMIGYLCANVLPRKRRVDEES